MYPCKIVALNGILIYRKLDARSKRRKTEIGSVFERKNWAKKKEKIIDEEREERDTQRQKERIS